MRDDDENNDDDDDDEDDDDDDEWQQGRERLLNPNLKVITEGGKGIRCSDLPSINKQLNSSLNVH